jgi:four helix bundle protein
MREKKRHDAGLFSISKSKKPLKFVEKAMNRELIAKNQVFSLSFQFSILVLNYCEILQQRKRFVVANQLARAGSSIGANIMEAQNAESRADFKHKMKIAAKEADETQYWLMLCGMMENYPGCDDLEIHLEKIQKMLSSILATLRRESPFGHLISWLFF